MWRYYIQALKKWYWTWVQQTEPNMCGPFPQSGHGANMKKNMWYICQIYHIQQGGITELICHKRKITIGLLYNTDSTETQWLIAQTITKEKKIRKKIPDGLYNVVLMGFSCSRGFTYIICFSKYLSSAHVDFRQHIVLSIHSEDVVLC